MALFYRYFLLLFASAINTAFHLPDTCKLMAIVQQGAAGDHEYSELPHPALRAGPVGGAPSYLACGDLPVGAHAWDARSLWGQKLCFLTCDWGGTPVLSGAMEAMSAS